MAGHRFVSESKEISCRDDGIAFSINSLCNSRFDPTEKQAINFVTTVTDENFASQYTQIA